MWFGIGMLTQPDKHAEITTQTSAMNKALYLLIELIITAFDIKVC